MYAYELYIVNIVYNPKKELPSATKALLHMLEKADEDTLAQFSADTGIAF